MSRRFPADMGVPQPRARGSAGGAERPSRREGAEAADGIADSHFSVEMLELYNEIVKDKKKTQNKTQGLLSFTERWQGRDVLSLMCAIVSDVCYRMVLPCFLGVSSWVWSLFWTILGFFQR